MDNDASSDVADKTSVPDSNSTDPALTFENLTFSDGTTITLDPNDVVVFVGPNNAGKSHALRELEEHIGPSAEGIVIKSATLRRTGTADELVPFIEQHARKLGPIGQQQYTGYRFSVPAQNIASYWSSNIGPLRQFFCMRIRTETRITDSNAAGAVALLDQPPSHPIHMLYLDDQIEQRISGYFHRAFGEDLIVFRLGGGTVPLLVGKCPMPDHGEDRISATYSDRLRLASVPLQVQGDGMRSFASVILHLLAPITHSVLLLDEPEAYLHPPQARLLGEIIANERSSRAQLFVATHSPDVLQGLLNVAPEHLRVLRIWRDGNVNRVRELDKARAKEISADPLMKYSSVMSGVFYRRVIIAESDADCLFYGALLDLPTVHGGQQPDVLFVHANGKHRMAALAEALGALDVPVDIIADMDILSEESILQRIVQALGGDWAAIQSEARPLKTAIEQQKPWLNASEVATGIRTILEKTPITGEFPRPLKAEVDALFRKASPWDAVKDAGEAAVPSGQPTLHYQRLQNLCNRAGLWIVPVGALEGFCKSVGGHGPRWVQKVIETKDLATSTELERARSFVSEIWVASSQ